MSLQAKIRQLKLDAALAHRHANGWQRLIDLYGEAKATEFYKHLGLNHLPQKSIEFDGLQLRRNPRPSEAIAVKGVAQTQDSSKERLANLLLKLRSAMITDALAQLNELNPADFHTLVVDIPATEAIRLKEQLLTTFNDARNLVVRELGRLPKGFVHNDGCNERFLKNEPRGYQCQCEWKESDVDDFDELETLTDAAVARIANDTQARIIGAASRLAMLGTTGESLITATQTEILAGSVSYIDRAATGLANRTISLGRGYEAEQRRDEWERVEYSALLDNNVCGPCLDADGETADGEDDLTPAPNPACEGYDNCRCFHVFVRD